MPVLPDVGSRIVWPGRIRPFSSASSISAARDAVLDRAGRVERLHLGPDAHAGLGRQAPKLDQRRVADRLDDVAVAAAARPVLEGREAHTSRNIARVCEAAAMFGAGHLLATYGVVGVGVVLFLETGLLLGLLLPGETLDDPRRRVQPRPARRPAAPAARRMVILMAGLGAAVGGQVGYALGRRAGDALHDRPDGRIYKRRVPRAHARVLRALRRRDDPDRPLHAVHPHAVEPGRGHRRDVGAALHDLQRRRAPRSGPSSSPRSATSSAASSTSSATRCRSRSGILAFSCIPAAIEYVRHRRRAD